MISVRLESIREGLVDGKQFAGAIRYLVNARSLQLEYARILHKVCPCLFLLYGSEIMVQRERKGLGWRTFVGNSSRLSVKGTDKRDVWNNEGGG